MCLSVPDFIDEVAILARNVTLHAARVTRVNFVQVHVPDEIGRQRSGVRAALKSCIHKARIA